MEACKFDIPFCLCCLCLMILCLFQFQERPLLPIGCGITAYFLFSGIHYFQKRDPINSQRMMRNRVIAQFMTLACFLGYIGGEQADFRLAPLYQEKLKKDPGSSNSGNSSENSES